MARWGLLLIPAGLLLIFALRNSFPGLYTASLLIGSLMIAAGVVCGFVALFQWWGSPSW